MATKTKRAPRTIRTISSKEPAVKKQALEDAVRTNLFLISPEKVLIAGVDTNDGPDHPCYQKHAHRPVDEEFVRSLIEEGILQPIVVWKDPDGNVYVVAGRRRVVGARLANELLKKEGSELLRVPCTVKRAEPYRLLGMKITENEQRENTGPMDKARDCQQYLNLGRTEEEAAARLRVTKQTVTALLKLLELAPAVQKAIEDGEIAYTAALKRCHGKTIEEQVEAIENPPASTKGRPPGPNRATIKKLVETIPREKIHPKALLALRFVLGEVTAVEAGLEVQSA